MTGRPIRLHLRRSVGRSTALPAIAVVLAHVVLRGFGWRHEWHWAVAQLTFVTIFTGPIAAGAGAWEGARWRRTSVPRGCWEARGVRALAAVGAWSLVPLAAGAVVVLAAVSLTGGAGGPRLVDVAQFGPAIALLLGWASVGFGVGWASRTAAVAPVVVVAAFALSVAGYVSPGHLVDVGGATGSLIGLQARRSVMASQVLLWSCVTGAALAAVCASATRRWPLAVTLALVGLGGVAFTWQTRLGGERLAPAPFEVHCTGHAPEICLAQGYERYRPQVQRVLAPTLAALGSRGAPLPVRLTQDGTDPGRDVGDLGRPDQLVTTFDAVLVVTNAYVPEGCDLFGSAEATHGFGVLGALLDPASQDPGPDGVVEVPSAAELRIAIDEVRTCGGRVPS